MINSHLLYRLSYHGTISISDAAFEALQHNTFSKAVQNKSCNASLDTLYFQPL